MLFKIGVAKNDLQTCNFIKKRFQMGFFLWNLQKHCENCCEDTLFTENFGGCFWFDSETYNMVELYLSLDSNFFLI